MTLPPGHRFEATKALRQVLARAVAWDDRRQPGQAGGRQPSAALHGEPPFESWAELEAVAAKRGPRYGSMVLLAAATGLRPGEWIALEQRDIDQQGRVVYVRRAYRNGRLKWRNPHALVGEGPPSQSSHRSRIVMPPTESTGALGADALGERTLAAGIEHSL